MHPQAANWITQVVEKYGLQDAPSVLDLGGRDVNGTIHGLFNAKVKVVDIMDGEGVDIVADAATWEPDGEYDVVLCTETFEHSDAWWSIGMTALYALRTGGKFIATMASRDRPPHSAIDGLDLREGEYYQNIDPEDLAGFLTNFRTFGLFAMDGYFGNDDLYCWAVK